MPQRSPDPRASKPFWSEQFDRTGQEPVVWLLRAQRLKKAAELLSAEVHEGLSAMLSERKADEETLEVYSKAELYPIYMLLAGLALENLMKGILIGRRPTLVNKGHSKDGKVRDMTCKNLQAGHRYNYHKPN